MRRDGLYARFGLQLEHHQGALNAGEAAMGLYAYCVIFSRLNELDGFVPTKAAERGWSGDFVANRERLELLCSDAVGYMAKVDGGYRILKYEEFNQTKADIEEDRKSARDRMRSVRANSRRTSAEHVSNKQRTCRERSVNVPNSNSISDPERDMDPEREAVTALPDWVQARDVEYMTAYVRGIESGKAGTYVFPMDSAALYELRRALTAFAKKRATGQPIKGNELLSWIEAAAHDFASSITSSGKAQFYSSYGPRGFVKWLNEEETKQEARRHG